jgi:hypothetical protein
MEANLKRVPLWPISFRVVMLGAGWQVADHGAEFREQSFSQRPSLCVRRAPA